MARFRPSRDARANKLRLTTLALTLVVAVLSAAVPGMADHGSSVSMGPPYAEAKMGVDGSSPIPCGVAVADLVTGRLTVAAKKAPSGFCHAGASVTGLHSLAEQAPSVTYHIEVFVRSVDGRGARDFETAPTSIMAFPLHADCSYPSCGIEATCHNPSCVGGFFYIPNGFRTNESLEFDLRVSRPFAPVPPGTVRVTVAAGIIGELVRSSNSSFLGFDAHVDASVVNMSAHIDPPMPDLTVRTATAPGTPTEGDATLLQAIVTNQGLADAPAFEVDLALKHGPDWDRCQDDPNTTWRLPVSGLAAGASTTLSAEWTATPTGPYDVHCLVASVDPGHVVVEVQERNNGGGHAFSVAQAVRGVDLSPDVQNQAVRHKGTVVYDIIVTNTGNAPDTILLSKGPDEAGWNSKLSHSSVRLEAGQSTTVQLTVEAPAKPSTFSVTVTGASQADPNAHDSAVAETTATAAP